MGQDTLLTVEKLNATTFMQGGVGAVTALTATTAQTIPTNTGLISPITVTGGAATTTILQKGTVNGQVVIVVHRTQTVANTVTFDVPANSFVWDDGTNPQVLKAGHAMLLVWDASLQAGVGAWVPTQPFAG
jgi:hypothetical protein